MPTAESTPLRLLRLWSLHAAVALPFSILIGIVTVMQFGFGLSEFGGLEYAPRVALLSTVRVIGPATSASAALLALLIWTHRLDAEALRSNLVRVAPWFLLMIVVAAPVTILLTVASAFATAHWAYGVPWATIVAAPRTLTPGDLPAAAETLALNAVLAGGYCWFALPPMTRRRWPLVQKIGATWGAMLLVRVAAELTTAGY